MKALSSLSRPYALPPPEVLDMHTLPLRLQRMIAILLLHQETLCLYPLGHIELHFHCDRVEGKLMCHLSRGKDG